MATYTANLNLEKPARGSLNYHNQINRDLDLIDSAHGTVLSQIDGLYAETYLLTDTFNGTTGVTVSLPKSVDSVNEYVVSITPTTRTASIGDIEVEKNTANFVVKSHGNNTADTFMANVSYAADVGTYGASVFRKWYVSPDSGITDHSDNTDTGSLAWVVDQIGSDKAVIEMPGNKTYDLADSLDTTTSSDDIYIIYQSGALIKPAATKSLTMRSPEHIIAPYNQTILDITSNSTNPLKFDKAGRFPVNWWGTTDEAAQAAITEFGRVPGCHMLFRGEHAWNGAVKLPFANDFEVPSKISGWGSKITSTVSAAYCLEFESGLYDVKLLTLEGLYFSCGGSESGAILFDADSSCTNFFYNVTLKEIYVYNFGGNAIEFEGCFFESRLYNCDVVAAGANTTGYGFYFNGSTQNQSSMSLYECTTRGGKYGVYAVGTKEVYINGGTYLLAQEEGVYLNSGRCTILNMHVEDNWAGAGTGAGLTFSGSGTIVGLRHQNDVNGQIYGMYLYIVAQNSTNTGAIQVVGGQWDQTQATAFIRATAQDTTCILTLDGNQTVYASDQKPTIQRSLTRAITLSDSGGSTSGTGEDDLRSHTVEEYMLPTRASMRIIANGTKTGSAGNKTIKFYVDTDNVSVHPAANNTNDWQLEVLLIQRTATVLDLYWKMLDGTSITQGDTSITQDYTADYDIKLTGECADGADSITQSNMIIEYL